MKHINIAIDGPAGAGKSTVARQVAATLSYLYIDTGAMYRAFTWKAINSSVSLEDGSALANLLTDTEILLQSHEGRTLVFVDGQDVSESIRLQEVTQHVSEVSAHKEIRSDLVKRQQKLASKKGAVLDGRDIGTTVLPDAELKVYLTASVEERARRRHEENIENGRPSDLENMKRTIAERDHLDMSREVSPLTKAKDAIAIDTTGVSIEDVVKQICRLAQDRIDSV